MPTQHNSSIYEGDAPQVDASSIITLKHAGALMLGKLIWVTTIAESSPHKQAKAPPQSLPQPNTAERPATRMTPRGLQVVPRLDLVQQLVTFKLLSAWGRKLEAARSDLVLSTAYTRSSPRGTPSAVRARRSILSSLIPWVFMPAASRICSFLLTCLRLPTMNRHRILSP